MPGWIGPAIGAIAGLIGGEQQNAANQGMTHQQMKWQEQMRANAHQVEVEDLRKAGLNPILSANSGAPQGSGSPIPMQDSIGKAITAGADTAKSINELQLGQSQRGLMLAQGRAADAGALRDTSTAKQTDVTRALLEKQAEALQKKYKNDAKEEEFRGKFMKFDQYGKRLDQGMGMVNKAKDMVFPGAKGLQLKRGESVINTRTGEIINERP